MGLVPAMPAAVKAARQTGGVTLESWLSQKTMRCAVSRKTVMAAGSISAGRDDQREFERQIPDELTGIGPGETITDMGRVWRIHQGKERLLGRIREPVDPACRRGCRPASRPASAGAERIERTM